MSDSASPLRQAFLRFWRPASVRFAVGILAMLVLAGTYAPFLSSETAIIWWGDDGLSFPLFQDLFNRQTFARPHDLLFNLASLLLPVFAIVFWMLRGKSVNRRLGWLAGILIGCWVICMLPVLPGDRAIWDYRKVSDKTSIEYLALKQAGHAPFAVFSPIPHRRDATYPGVELMPPGSVNPATGSRFWLGTDPVGRDIASLLLFGARISLTIGFIATGISLFIGVVIGGVSAFFGGWIDLLLQRVVETMMCFPTFILILTIVAMVGHNIFYIMLIIGLTSWAGVARIVRGEFLAQTQCDYVSAARAIGASNVRIIFRHILPNAIAPIIITATFGIAGAVLGESGLSFLGFGDPTTASWGLVLDEGRENISYAWLIYAPGIAIFLLVTSLNVIGNGLRDAFDPKSS